MKWVRKILNKFNGLYYPQEYLCLADELFERPLHTYLVDSGQVIKDITKLHSFVGYHPLVFSLPLAEMDPVQPARIHIAFTQEPLLPNASLSQKDAVAWLTMKKIAGPAASDDAILFYEGEWGQHHFVSSFHRFIIQLNNRLYNKKPGNVFLPGNLYKQVQIAYSLPRNISLVTVGQHDHFNLFPTDLHGPAGEDHYVISLRQGGKACRQVMNAGKILLTQVHSDFYKMAYLLGKNHMQELKEKEKYPFSDQLSDNLQLPLPQSALLYRELELKDSFDHGIHRLMVFKTLCRQRVRDIPSTLAHIHNAYATWRHNKDLAGNYLLR